MRIAVRFPAILFDLTEASLFAEGCGFHPVYFHKETEYVWIQ